MICITSLIHEMLGASSRRLGAFDPERRIDNQCLILYYSISCNSHPGGVTFSIISSTKGLLEKGVSVGGGGVFENLQLIGLV